MNLNRPGRRNRPKYDPKTKSVPDRRFRAKSNQVFVRSEGNKARDQILNYSSLYFITFTLAALMCKKHYSEFVSYENKNERERDS